MRVYKFKGKGIEGSGWHHGSLDFDGLRYFIRKHKKQANGFGSVLSTQVEPESIGQFTGLYDKDGNEIYEGDIVKVPGCIDRGDGFFDDDICEVKWENETACYIIEGFIKRDIFGYIDLEVISNIYDNPELLES